MGTPRAAHAGRARAGPPRSVFCAPEHQAGATLLGIPDELRHREPGALPRCGRLPAAVLALLPPRDRP
eukprot:15475858-Alexandrium_andersonii.AAC.1